jgi:NADH-quinone oxidoreductase subunit A
MDTQFLPYIAIGITLAILVGLALAILGLNAVLGPKVRGGTKDMAFEAGSIPIDSPRKRLNVRYYAVAIFFVVFDIEAVFLFPWAVLYRDLVKSPVFGLTALVEILLFLGILAVGLWYVWGKGALDWAFDAPRGRGGDHE